MWPNDASYKIVAASVSDVIPSIWNRSTIGSSGASSSGPSTVYVPSALSSTVPIGSSSPTVGSTTYSSHAVAGPTSAPYGAELKLIVRPAASAADASVSPCSSWMLVVYSIGEPVTTIVYVSARGRQHRMSHRPMSSILSMIRCSQRALCTVMVSSSTTTVYVILLIFVSSL